MEASADCVVVGGGIGGVVLAVALGRKGRRVVLCERDEHPHQAARPEILAASTIQTIRELGVPEGDLRNAIVPLQGLEMRRAGGERLLSIADDDFTQAGVRPHSVDPGRVRALLLETAERLPSVRVERGVEVQALTRTDGRVTGVQGTRHGAPVAVRAALVVGDDGGRSQIRAALGIPLRTTEFPLVFLGASGPALPGQPPAAGAGWINPPEIRRGVAAGLFLPLPGGRTAFVFLAAPKTVERFQRDPARFYEAVERVSPWCRGLQGAYPFPQAFTVFHRPFGHAPRYVADGAALLGDAAHPVTPAGGQGANMSVADALALAQVAEEALKAHDLSAARLGAYEAIRRGPNDRSLQFSVGAARALRVLLLAPWLGSLLPRFLRRVDRDPEAKRRFLRALAQAFRSP